MSFDMPTKKGNSNSKTIQPLYDKVLIEQVAQETKTASGIILPGGVDKDQNMKEGKVVEVGPGRLDDGKRIPVEVKKGDIVLFQWGEEIKVDGKEYFLVNENNISAIIK